MMRKIAIVLAVAMALGTAAPAGADPGPLVRRLMETPVTLLSFGLMRLQLMLDEIARDFPGGAMLITSSYDWDANRIRIEADLDHANPDRTACAEALGFLRGKGRVHAREDDRYAAEWMEGSAYAALFGHIGFTEPQFPRDLERRLDEIIELRVVLYPEGGGFPKDPVRRCESRLMRPSETSHRDG